MNIFLEASRKKLRFNCSLGNLTVEDLWALSLSSRSQNAVTLNTLAISAHEEIQKAGKVSFVGSAKSGNKTAELQLEILKTIIEIKEKEAEDATQREATRSRIEKLKELKAKKAEDALENLTEEELDAELAKLQG